MSNSSSASSSQIGVCGLLGVVFVVLKLLDKIDWSWWWVTAPFWGGVAIVIGFFLLWVGGVAVWFFVLEPFLRWRKRRASKNENS